MRTHVLDGSRVNPLANFDNSIKEPIGLVALLADAKMLQLSADGRGIEICFVVDAIHVSWSRSWRG